MITLQQIAPLYKQGIDYEWTERLKENLAKLRSERHPLYLTASEFDEILRWKLGNQYRRQQKMRAANTEEIIRAVTRLALTIEHDDKDYELELRMDLLCALRGVSAPVASAVLALTFPDEYAVIDFRVWRQLFDEDKREFFTPEYKKHIRKIRPLAKQLGWRVQEVDYAIWEFDRRNSK